MRVATSTHSLLLASTECGLVQVKQVAGQKSRDDTQLAVCGMAASAVRALDLARARDLRREGTTRSFAFRAVAATAELSANELGTSPQRLLH